MATVTGSTLVRDLIDISSISTTGNVTVGGYLAGPSTFTIDPAGVGDNTGTVVIAGNLQVDGTTTTINSTTVTVDDLNLTLASGAANAAAANGAGLTVDGANATITYDSSNDEWDFNKNINITGNLIISGTVDGRDVAADGTKLDGIEAGATADQTLGDLGITATAAEINKLDGVTATTAELNYIDGVTSNIQTQLNGKLSTTGTAAQATNLNATDDRDIAPEDLSYSDDLRIYFADKGGLETGTIGSNYQDVLVLNSYSDSSGGDANALAFDKSEKKIYHYQADQSATNWGTAKTLAYTDDISLSTLSITATAAEINKLDGVTATTTELNYVDGVTSNIQTQLDAKLNSSSYTASDVLTKIKTVDGSGSGLDADLLDGISSASFLRSDAADTASGHLTLSAGTSSDGNGRFYSWRAVQNTSSQTPNYVRIARITGSQSQRVSIELTGSYAGYGDGTIASWGKLVGQLNNDNNYDFIFYDFKSGGNSDNSRVVEEIAQIDISTTETDIYVKVLNFSEIAAFGYVSDGSITPYSDNITTTEPSNYSTITKIEVWNSNNDGSGSGLDADLLDGQQGSYYLDYQNLTNTPGAAARIEEFPTVTNGSASVTMANSYTLNRLDVYLNGARMKSGTDYSVSGTTLTFTENLQTGDIVAIYAYDLDVNNLITGNWNDLNDVSVTGASANDIIRYDGGSWVVAPASIDSSGNLTTNGDLIVSGGQVGVSTVSTRHKYSVYGSSGQYAIGMQSGITFGGLADWGMTFQFNNDDDRGFWWGDESHSTAQGAMALTTNGKLTVAHSTRIGYGETDTTIPGATHRVDVNGSVNATTYHGDGSNLTGISAGATGGSTDQVFYENDQTITTNYTITTNKNAMTAGPITINTGVTVTIPTGSEWSIV